jgi:Ca-activated chloride channel family protein
VSSGWVRQPALFGLVAALGAALAGAGPGVGAAAQQPVFSTRVDTVRVDVEVRRGGRLANGLTAADFEVFDNGVRQTVDLVTASTLPVSVVLALDTSASLDAAQRAHLSRAGRRLIDELKPGESAALVTFSGRVTIPTTFTADTARLRTLVAAPAASGDTALRDAAHVAMLLGSTAPGRPLVILLSDGDDTASFLSAEAVLETAQRTGAVVSVVKIGRDSELLRELTAITGGALVKEQSLDRVAERFSELLDSFRNRYLVSFTPTDRGRPGWHRLSVRVKGGDEVRARTGYWSGS